MDRIARDTLEMRDEGLKTGTICLRRSGRAYCPLCEKPVDLMTFSYAADFFKTDTQDIEFLAKNGELHRVHNRKGEVLICSDSLFHCFNNRQTRLLDSHFESRISKDYGAPNL